MYFVRALTRQKYVFYIGSYTAHLKTEVAQGF